MPSAARGDHHHLVHAGVAEDADLGPVENPPAFGALRGHGDRVQRPPAGVVGERQRPGDRTGGHRREEPLTLLGGADLAHHGGELGHGGQEGAGGDDPAELLGHDGGLHEGEPQAVVLLGNGQGGPVECHHGGPERLWCLAGLDNGAHQVEGALLVKEGTDGRSQLVLLAGEFELHHPPPPASPVPRPTPVAGHRGRPAAGECI